MMNSVLGGRSSKNRQMPDVVPETPESNSSRSRRTSTLNSSAATRSFLMQSSKGELTPGSRGSPGSKVEQTRIEQTPDNTVQLGQKTIIAETPDDTVLDATKVSDVEDRAASLGIFSNSPTLLPSTKMKVKHGPKMRQLPTMLPSEESFILSSQQQVNSTFVAGLRDLEEKSKQENLPSPMDMDITQQVEAQSPIIKNISSSSRRKKGRPVKISREASPSKEKPISSVLSPSKEKQKPRDVSPNKEKHEMEVEKHKNRLKSAELSSSSPTLSKDKNNLNVDKRKNLYEPSVANLAITNEEKELEIEKHKKRLKLAESSLASQSREKGLEIENHRIQLKLAESTMSSPSRAKDLEIEKHKNRLKLAESSLASQSKEKELEIERHKNKLMLAQSSLASPSRERELEIEKHRQLLQLPQTSKPSPSIGKASPKRGKAPPSKEKLTELNKAPPTPNRVENNSEVEKHRQLLQLPQTSRESPSRSKPPPSKEKTESDVEKHRNRLKSAESSRASFGCGEKIRSKGNDKSNVPLDLSEQSSLNLLQEDSFRTENDNCDGVLDLSTDSNKRKKVQPNPKSKLAPVYESDSDMCEKDSFLDLGGLGQVSPEKYNGKTSDLKSKLQKSATTPKSTITPKTAKKDTDKRRSRRSNVNKDDFLAFLYQKEKSPDRDAPKTNKKPESPISDNIFANNNSDSDSDDGWEAMMASGGSIKKFLPTIDPNRKSVVISGNIKSRTKQNLEKPSANVLPAKSSKKCLNDELNKHPEKSSKQSGKSVRVVNEKAKENIYEIGGLGEIQEDSVYEENEKSAFNVDETNVTLSRRRSQKVQPQKKLKSASATESNPSLSNILNVSTSSQNISSTRAASSKSVGNVSLASSSTSTIFPRGGARPLSFQDFSTDSAKALIGMFEKGEYVSDGEDKSSKDSRGAEAAVKPKSNSMKRKSTALTDTPVSKRSRNSIIPEATGSIPKITEDLIPSSAVKATPLRTNLTAPKDKTSLSPIPMDLCSSPLIRRSGRASTQISTVASDNFTKSPVASAAKLGVSPEVKSSQDAVETPKAKSNIWKTPLVKSGENSAKSSRVKSKETVNKISENDDGTIAKSSFVSESPSSAPTQPAPTEKALPAEEPSLSSTLAGKVVYVEYYAGNENRSKGLKKICISLGAEVVERLSSNVTHFVFKDGNPGNYMKAKKIGIHIVSATWVEECKTEKKVVQEDLFPHRSKQNYDSPSVITKLKKGKSMQVRDLEEDVERARVAQEKKAKMLEKKKQKEKEEADLKKKNAFNVVMPTHDLYYKGANGIVAKNKPVESSGLLDVLAEFQSPSGTPLKLQRRANLTLTPDSPSDVDFDTPLAKRIAAKYRSPAVETPSSTSKSVAPKPFLGESPLTLDTPNPIDKRKSVRRTRLIPDLTKEDLENAKETESLSEHVASESPRRRSGRASTQIVTKATASVCNQSKTSPTTLDTSPPPLPSQKDSISIAVPSTKNSSSNEVESHEDKSSGCKEQEKSFLDESNYGNPILESTRAEPKSRKSMAETNRAKSTKAAPSSKSNPKNLPPTKNGKPNVESELLFDSLIQRASPEKGKNQEEPGESDLLFDSLLQSSSTEKKVINKGCRDRSLPTTREETLKVTNKETKKKVTKSHKSPEKVPLLPINEKSPDQSSLSLNKSPRLVAPWRHLEELNNEETTDPGNDDVYEFTGFGDEPAKSSEDTPTVKPRKKAGSKPPLPATTSPPIGRPSTNRMFSIGLPARKRKLDESPSKSQSGTGSPSRSTKEKSEVCPAIQKISPPPTEVLDATPNLSTVENVTTITSEGIFVTEHQNTTKKHVLLSKIFSKPPAKETDSKQINSESEEELKSTKKHKLFNQKSDILDQTASPGSVRDTQHIPNVHTGEANVASQSKTVINNKDGAAFAQPPKSSSFKKPKNKKPKVSKHKKKTRSSSSESSEPSDSDSASSDGNSFPTSQSSKSSQGSKNNSKVKKLNPPRRSSLEFQPLPKFARKLTEKSGGDSLGEVSQGSQGSQRGKRGKKVVPTNNIVCTSCHKDDINLVRELIKNFGKFSFSDSVNINTSHVISGEGRRTLNLLKGLLQGCWLVTKEWVLASLEEGKWTDEEPYEMVDFSPAVRSVRLDKAAFEGAFKSDLFRDCGVVYVSTSCRAPREELKQLIISGGGSVANLVKVSDIIVGEDRSDITTCCVTEKWILDSIQFHVIMPFADYTYLPKETDE